MIYGAGEPSEEPPKVIKKKKKQPAGGVPWALSMYFLRHPKVSMTTTFSTDDRDLLFLGMTRLVRDGLSEENVQRGIDMFWHHPAAKYNRPVLSFLAKEMQDKLMVGMRRNETFYANWVRDTDRKKKNSGLALEYDNLLNDHHRIFKLHREAIDWFIANDFSIDWTIDPFLSSPKLYDADFVFMPDVRYPPWPRSYDKEIRRRCTTLLLSPSTKRTTPKKYVEVNPYYIFEEYL